MQNKDQNPYGSEHNLSSFVVGKDDAVLDKQTIESRDEFATFKSKGLNFRPFLRMVQRNFLLIAGINIAVAVGIAASSLRAPRSFEGTFRILVEPITADAKLTDPTVLSRQGSNPSTSSLDYPTLLQVLQSPELLGKITQQIQTRVPAFPANGLTGKVMVQRFGTNILDSAKIIDVKYAGGDPKTVKIVLEELARGYLNYSLEDRKVRIGGGVEFIEDQLPGLRQRVNDLENSLQSLQQQYQINDPSAEGALLSQQAKAIETQQVDTQRDLQEQIALYNNLQNQLKLAPDEAIPAAALSEEPRYQALLTQLKTIESQIAVKSARFSEDSPVIQALRDQERNLKQLLDQEAQSILGQSAGATNPQVSTFQNSIRIGLIGQLIESVNKAKVLEVRRQAVLQNQDRVDQQLEQFPEIARRYGDLKRQLDLATKTLDQLLIQRETLRVEAAQKEVPWQMVAAPDVRRDPGGNPMPVARETGKTLAVGLVAGFILGLIAAVIKDKLSNVFHTTEDVQDATDVPLFGVIPFEPDQQYKLAQLRGSGSSASLDPSNSQVTLFQEAFNALYASLCFLSGEPPVRSLVISSAAPGEGKTTVAVHLAHVAAMLGRRVLLVDANLLTPQIHVRLDLANAYGLADVLAKDLSLDDIIQPSNYQENLFVLTAGNCSPSTGRQLASTRMKELMAKFDATFDLVIYDSPHLLGLSDTNFVAAQSDGLLMVVGVGKTKRPPVMQVLSGLQEFRLPVLGMVANYVTRGKRSSFGYRHRYYQPNSHRRSSFGQKLQGLNASVLSAVSKKNAS
jgi:polysaccharide biosynthesis transport protein